MAPSYAVLGLLMSSDRLRESIMGNAWECNFNDVLESWITVKLTFLIYHFKNPSVVKPHPCSRPKLICFFMVYSLFSLGSSSDDSEVNVISITAVEDVTQVPHFAIFGGMSEREHISTATLLQLAVDLCSNYSKQTSDAETDDENQLWRVSLFYAQQKFHNLKYT